MRASAAAAPALVTLGLLLAADARADDECQRAFERWAKVSSARVVPQGTSGRGACVPTEAVRNDLLEGLSRARGLCAESSSDQQQTRTLLNINLSFIASLSVCPASQSANVDTGWVTKAAPDEETTRVAPPRLAPAPPPLPAPPRVAVPAPPPLPPKAVAAAPLPSPAPPAASAQPAGPPPAPPCIDISRAQNDSFALVNRRCRGHTVLAVIETPGAAGETVCRGYSINHTLAVRAPAAEPPRINYECVVGQGPCNKDRLGDMFPECDW